MSFVFHDGAQKILNESKIHQLISGSVNTNHSIKDFRVNELKCIIRAKRSGEMDSSEHQIQKWERIDRNRAIW